MTTRTLCPVGRQQSEPCPRKRATGRYHECQECLDDWRERAAILEYGQGTGGSPERPTCDGRVSAEAEATAQIRAELGRDKQGSLF